MDVQTITMIIIACVGAIMSLLLGVVSFFAVRSYNGIDSNMSKHSDSIGQLALSVNDLGGIIKSLEMQFITKHDDIERTLTEHREEIELLRARSHATDNHITAMRILGERNNGWKFSSDWALPGLNILHNKQPV